MRKLLLVAVVSAVVILPLHAVLATQNGGGHIPITLCHRTGSEAGGNQHNGYDLITIDLSAVAGINRFRAHDHHEQVGNGPGPDIIPPATYTVLNGPDKGDVVSYPGKGLDWVFDDGTTGQEFLDNGCQFNEQPPPTSPPPTSPPPTSPPPTSPPPTSPPPTVPPVINPAASITNVTCRDTTVTVTLDNSASTDGDEEGGTAQFIITLNGESVGAGELNVAAGSIAQVDVGPLADGSVVKVLDARDSSVLASLTADLSTCVSGGGGTPPPPTQTPPTVTELPVTL